MVEAPDYEDKLGVPQLAKGSFDEEKMDNLTSQLIQKMRTTISSNRHVGGGMDQNVVNKLLL